MTSQHNFNTEFGLVQISVPDGMRFRNVILDTPKGRLFLGFKKKRKAKDGAEYIE